MNWQMSGIIVSVTVWCALGLVYFAPAVRRALLACSRVARDYPGRAAFGALAACVFILYGGTKPAGIDVQTFTDDSGNKWFYRDTDNATKAEILAVAAADEENMDLVVPDKVGYLCDNDASKLSVTAIAANAFAAETNTLKSIVVPSSVTTLATGTFANFSALTNVTVGVGTLATASISNCSALVSLKISAAEIATHAIVDCPALSAVDLGLATSIASGAIASCPALKSLTVPGSIEILTAGALAETVLTNVTLASGVETIAVDALPTTLKALDVPSSVTGFAENLFKDYVNLESVTIAEGALSSGVGAGAFSNCVNLASIALPASCQTVGASAFNGCTDLAVATFPAATSIGESAFYGTKLGEVVLPNTLTSLGESAFAANASLTSVVFQATCQLTEIPATAFSGCPALAEIEFPASIESVGNGAFSGTKLGDVTIPATLTAIDANAFDDCSSLTNVHFLGAHNAAYADGMFGSERPSVDYAYDVRESWSGKTFAGGAIKPTLLDGDDYMLAADGNVYYFNVTEGPAPVVTNAEFYYPVAVVPATFKGSPVTQIAADAFAGEADLQDVTFTNGTCVGIGAFDGCTTLTNVTLGTAVNEIGAEAFAGCVKLETVNLPDTLLTLGSKAFWGCEKLKPLNFAWATNEDAVVRYDLVNYTDVASDEQTDGIRYLDTQKTYAVQVKKDGSEMFTIPANVAYLGTNAFAGTSWSEISVENGTRLGSGAFVGADNLEAVHVSGAVTFAAPDDVATLTATNLYLLGEPDDYGWDISSDYLWITNAKAHFPAVTLAYCKPGMENSWTNSMFPYASAGFTIVPLGAEYYTKFDVNAQTLGSKSETVVTPAVITNYYGKRANLPGIPAGADGYTFKGWARVDANDPKWSSGLLDVYAAGATVVNLTTNETNPTLGFLALWTTNTYEIAYLKNKPANATSEVEGENASVTNTFDVPATLDASPYSLTGWTFLGWTTNAAGSGFVFQKNDDITNISTGDDVEFYAKWQANKFTVAYDIAKPEGATGDLNTNGIVSAEFTYDQDANLTNVVPSLTGWTFAGWTNAVGKVFQASASVKNASADDGATVTYWATWSANEFEVSYDANKPENATSEVDMTGIVATTNVYDQEAHLVDVKPTLKGWTFLGWTTNAIGEGTMFPAGADVKNISTGADVKFYAQWKAKTYEVTFNSNPGASSSAVAGGENMGKSYTNTYDTASALASNDWTMAGYEFVGWNTKMDGTGASFADGADAVNALFDESADGKVELYAQWAAIAYRVAFVENAPEMNGGQTGVGMEEQEFEYDVPQELSALGYAFDGYTFLHWTNDVSNAFFAAGYEYADGETVSNLTTVADAVVANVAVWSVNSYTVVFDANDDEYQRIDDPGVATNAVTKRCWYETVELPKLKRTGYTFTGWTADMGEFAVSGIGPDVEVISNACFEAGATVTLTAQWRANTYKVSFSTNKPETEGTVTGEMEAQAFDYSLPGSIASNAFALVGYEFAGWNSKADGTGASYADGQADVQKELSSGDDVTLYAQWTPITYTVTFEPGEHGQRADGADVEWETMTLTYDMPTNLNKNAFVRDGLFRFERWTSALGSFADGEKVLNLTTVAGTNVILTGVWGSLANWGMVGRYYYRTLMGDDIDLPPGESAAGLGIDIPTVGGNVTAVALKAEGLPKGVKLVSNKKAAKPKDAWYLEGVPTEPLDPEVCGAFVRVTVTDKASGKPVKTERIYQLPFGVNPAEEVVINPFAVLNQDYGSLQIADIWPGAGADWAFKGWPSGIKFSKGVVSGTPKKFGAFAVTGTRTVTSVAGKPVKENLAAVMYVFGADPGVEPVGNKLLYSDVANVEVEHDVAADVKALGIDEVKSVEGLPEGIDYAEGIAKGTPTAAGYFPVTITDGGGNKKMVLWRIKPAVPDIGFVTGKVANGGDVVDGVYVLQTGLFLGDAKTMECDAAFKFTTDPTLTTKDLKVAGLPAGLKLVSLGNGEWAIAGIPSKAGNFVATLTVKKDGITTMQRLAFEVQNNPLVGAFDGEWIGDDGKIALASLSVAANGKSTFTLTENGKKSAATIKSIGAKEFSAAGGTYVLEFAGLKGGIALTIKAEINEEGYYDYTVTSEIGDGALQLAHRYSAAELAKYYPEWTENKNSAVQSVLVGIDEDWGTEYETGYFTITWNAAKATATVKGKFHDGAALSGTATFVKGYYGESYGLGLAPFTVKATMTVEGGGKVPVLWYCHVNLETGSVEMVPYETVSGLESETVPSCVGVGPICTWSALVLKGNSATPLSRGFLEANGYDLSALINGKQKPNAANGLVKIAGKDAEGASYTIEMIPFANADGTYYAGWAKVVDVNKNTRFVGAQYTKE